VIVFVAVLALWILSLCVHEYAHARVAYAGGDVSVRAKGYLSFNPLVYMDPVHSLLWPTIFLLLGGFGLPGGAVWIDRSRLRTRGWMTATSLAGPAANLAVFLLLAAPFAIGAAPDPYASGDQALWSILAFAAFTQATAAILNLLPLPGLDGFGALEPWLPYSVIRALAPYRGYTMVILLILAFSTPLGAWILHGAVRLMAALGIDGGHLARGYDAFFSVIPWR